MSPAPRILVVDDEETITFSLSRFLERRGYECDSALTLSSALELLTTRQYDAVLADVRLNSACSRAARNQDARRGAEGLKILSFVRENRPGTKILLLTAYGSADLDADLLARGDAVLLHKPIALPSLASALSRALGEPQGRRTP